MSDDLRSRLATDVRLADLSAGELDAIVDIAEGWRWPPSTGNEDRREPEIGQVWREKSRQYAKRTVVVLGFIDATYANVPGRFVQVRTLTDYTGQPVTRKAVTKVRAENWHKQFVYVTAEATPTTFVQHGDMAVELPGIEPDKVVDLMAALEQSIAAAKEARRRDPQPPTGGPA